jgi:hypothetical protein
LEERNDVDTFRADSLPTTLYLLTEYAIECHVSIVIVKSEARGAGNTFLTPGIQSVSKWLKNVTRACRAPNLPRQNRL